MEHIFNFISDLLSNSIGYLVNPNKRVFFPYLITSALLAFYVYKKSDSQKSFISFLLPSKYWLSKSAQTDYKILLLNSIVKFTLLSPLLLLATSIALFSYDFLVDTFGLYMESHNKVVGVLLFTLCLTIVSDFFSYLLHLAMHKVPLLWEFHKTHHSATSLIPFTQYRIHPVELLLNNFKNIIVVSTITGIFFYYYGFNLQKSTVIGVNVLHFLFLSLGANLRHSHIKLPYYDFVEFLLISPYQHQIHHSNNPEHFNKNMGSKFAVWDLLFGTLLRSKQVDKVTFGLGDEEPESNSFRKNMIDPFRQIFK